jgi:hypothetical protein
MIDAVPDLRPALARVEPDELTETFDVTSLPPTTSRAGA